MRLLRQPRRTAVVATVEKNVVLGTSEECDIDATVGLGGHGADGVSGHEETRRQLLTGAMPDGGQ